MSTQILASSSQNEKIHKILRPTKKFQPPVWGERFLHYNISEQELRYKQQQVEELKEVVKKEIFGESAYDVSHQLKLINVVERLGLSYHFESEIENELESIYNKSVDQNYILKDENLHDASLRFRLLRQHGFRVSSADIFEKFKDEDGNFKECLVSDTIGLLSLYEASHLSCVGENILDEALAFTTTHLTEFLANKKEHDDPLSKEISQALERPLRKSLERLAARHFISIYENETSNNNKVLLQLAKLDFNLLQSMHKKELSDISRWWKESDFVRKFPFARDRIVELYLWILAVYYEPQYSLARNILTKIIAFASIADDIYDAYGTFEELELLTEAVERWDINIIDKLNPEYLQTYYKELLNSYEEFEQELSKEETYRVHYAKERFKELLRSYLEEAWWLKEGRVPSFDEYLKFSLINCGYHMLIVSSLIGMKSSIVTKEVFEWLSMDCKIVRASSTICRFMDDIAEHKFEQEKNDEPTAVECYMKQYGVSEEEAYDELNKQIANAWKEINEELLKPTGVASPILVRVLNFSKFMDLFYKNGDSYTQVGKVAKDSVAALLIDPIP